jgi:hypothetical protein
VIPIRLDYYENTGAASVLLEWLPPGGVRAMMSVIRNPSVGDNPDRCDGRDNDCSGMADDRTVSDGVLMLRCTAECTPGTVRSCGQAAVGVCHPGAQTCLVDGTWDACAGEQRPAASDPCDGVDNDCNGVTDPGCACVPPSSQACEGGSRLGICHAGTQSCNAGQWSACTGQQNPLPRDCRSALDNDCNGAADNTESQCTTCTPVTGAPYPCQTHPQDGTGACRAGSQICSYHFDFTSVDLTQACTGSVGPSSTWHYSPISGSCGSPYNSVACWDFNCDGVVQKETYTTDPPGCNANVIDTWCKNTFSIPNCSNSYRASYTSTSGCGPGTECCGQNLCIWKCFYSNVPSYPYCQGWGDTATSMGCR